MLAVADKLLLLTMFVRLAFQYLGCIEVFEATGLRICEEAVQLLKNVSSQTCIYCVGFFTWYFHIG